MHGGEFNVFLAASKNLFILAVYGFVFYLKCEYSLSCE